MGEHQLQKLLLVMVSVDKWRVYQHDKFKLVMSWHYCQQRNTNNMTY